MGGWPPEWHGLGDHVPQAAACRDVRNVSDGRAGPRNWSVLDHDDVVNAPSSRPAPHRPPSAARIRAADLPSESGALRISY